MNFGVNEILGLLDFQASVFVGDEVNNGYPLVVRSSPERSCALWWPMFESVYVR